MLTKLKLALLISAPLVAGATTYAVADDGAKPDAAQRAEHHKEKIARFDLNKDGKLDDTERAAMRDTLATERFKAMDKNGDGVLSLDEFKAGAQRLHRHGRHGHARTHGDKVK